MIDPRDLRDDVPTLADDDESQDERGRIGYGRYERLTPIVLGLVLVLGVIGIAIVQQRDTGDGPSSTSKLINQPAPAMALTTFDGDVVTLEQHRGKVVVLNFWASWCDPCRREMPLLQAAQSDDVVVIGVDLKNDKAADAQAFAAKIGATYPMGQDIGSNDPLHGPIELSFGSAALYPTTIFISPDGTISGVHIGELTGDLLDAAIRKAETKAS